MVGHRVSAGGGVNKPSITGPGQNGTNFYNTAGGCTNGVGGTVPATISLTLGANASFGAFAPGVDRDYTAVDDRERDLERG